MRNRKSFCSNAAKSATFHDLPFRLEFLRRFAWVLTYTHTVLSLVSRTIHTNLSYPRHSSACTCVSFSLLRSVSQPQRLHRKPLALTSPSLRLAPVFGQLNCQSSVHFMLDHKMLRKPLDPQKACAYFQLGLLWKRSQS